MSAPKPPAAAIRSSHQSEPSSAALHAATEALRDRRFVEATGLLSPLVAAYPRAPNARYLLAVALKGLRDFAGAERELRAAIAQDKRRPHFHCDLGVLLKELGRLEEAEHCLRAAVALDRRFDPAIVPLSDLLVKAERAEEALRLTAPLVAGRGVGEDVLSAHAEALKAAGRLEECLATYQQAAESFSRSPYVDHNLAAVLGDLGRHPEAEAAARRALAKGLDHAATWLVLGRALQRQDRFDEAEDALRRAIRRAPANAVAHADLAQLVWMRTGNAARAGHELNAASRTFPSDPALKLALASLLEFAGDQPGAYAVLAGAAGPHAPVEIDVAAARAIVQRDPERALRHAEVALGKAPNGAADLAYCEALLACGRPEDALPIIERLRQRLPFDQHVLAYQATAWRLLGDPRYAELYDYAALVRPALLDTPEGWTSLPSYLADLKTALAELHGLKTHPLGQSLRAGTQTNQKLERSQNPAIRAFFQAIDGPVRRHLEAVGRGKDPFRARNQGRYALAGSWSVRLQPGEGRHVDHVHQQGWISSACYIDLPPAVDEAGRQGWIKFGEPGTPTAPTLAPEHYVKPEPGMLVLFPSYMWHGTTPFSGDQPRLTVAFDLVPA